MIWLCPSPDEANSHLVHLINPLQSNLQHKVFWPKFQQRWQGGISTHLDCLHYTRATIWNSFTHWYFCTVLLIFGYNIHFTVSNVTLKFPLWLLSASISICIINHLCRCNKYSVTCGHFLNWFGKRNIYHDPEQFTIMRNKMDPKFICQRWSKNKIGHNYKTKPIKECKQLFGRHSHQ